MDAQSPAFRLKWPVAGYYFKISWFLRPRGADGLAPPDERRAFSSSANSFA
jgi:hypothetical protein